jgi:superfamily II DNA or RNA helicase
LTRLNPGDPAYEKLSQTKVFLADEAHLVPCQTLAKVCFGLVANAPYRYFLTGTLFRNDGLDLLLEGITGPPVYKMTVQDGVDSGFLAKPNFRMCWSNSDVKDKNGNLFESSDANEMTRNHIFYNVELNKKAAELANKSVSLMSRPVVILIDELEQLVFLKDHLRFEFKFCHGGVTKENKNLIPTEYHKSDPQQLVKDFNEGKFPILIGTSCIGIGTDIRPVKTILNLRGGKSEVEISQNIGRGTRLAIGKEDFLYIDFGIRNVPMLEKHARERMKIFKRIYPGILEVAL